MAACEMTPLPGEDMAGLLAHHDVVYLSPNDDGRHALPVGNGDLTAMVWTPADRLQLQVNKSNLWYDGAETAVDWSAPRPPEERISALLSAAQVCIRHPFAPFELLYLDDFEARLELYQGRVLLRSDSPRCRVRACIYAARDPAVLVIDYEDECPEPVEREIMLSRWGSRRQPYFMNHVWLDTRVGLEGTASGSDGQRIWLTQELPTLSFAVAARFVGAPHATGALTRHASRVVTSTAAHLKGQLYLAVVTSEEDPDPLAAALRRVDDAAARGEAAIAEAHRRQWAGFWGRSFIRIPEDYLENLYYFTLYQLASCSRGPYPMLSCGGGWTWNHDVRRWAAYFHWNVQAIYWPVQAANHPELAESYNEFRHSNLPQARQAAREHHEVEGAYYADVTDRLGRSSVTSHTKHNLTVGTQIAMDLWRHFLFTQDIAFLRHRAYPVMAACAEFYANYLERDAGGVYHVPRSTNYEDILLQRDSVTDLAAIRQSFAACIEASERLGVDEACRQRWRKVLAHLPGFRLLDLPAAGGKPARTVISTGYALAKGAVTRTQRPFEPGEPIFNDWFFGPLAPVFPAGLVGVGQRGTPLYEAAVGSLRELGHATAWQVVPIAAARLGLGEEALAELQHFVTRFQTLRQGFFQEGHAIDGCTEQFGAWLAHPVRDGRLAPEKVPVLTRYLDIPAIDTNGIVMTALQEMLLQSHEGLLRLFPACPAGWRDASFRLAAAGGFLVSARRVDGETAWALVHSRHGGTCRVANPWPGQRGAVTELKELTELRELKGGGAAELIEFETQPHATYLLYRASAPQPRLEVDMALPRNEGPKTSQGRTIGIERYY